MIRQIAMFILSAVLAGCATHRGLPATAQPKPVRADVHVIRGVVYTPPGWPQSLTADLYKPVGVGPFPGVVMVHGGGWTSRTRADMDSTAEAVARRGYVVMNISYRLAPRWNFPAPLRDVQQAIRWLRANAANHDVQADRIATWGYSAGAHLAALAGVLNTEHEHFAEDARVQAVVAGGTPVDVRYYPKSPLTNALMGVSFEQNPDLWRKASPLAWVSPGDPPVFLYHGTFDFTVGVENSRAMFEALNAAGVPAELYLIRGLEHFSTFFISRPVNRGIDFLDRHLRAAPALPGALFTKQR